MIASGTELRNRIIDYYDSTYHLYRILWMDKGNRAMHVGFTDEQVKNHGETLNNMNRVVADRVAIREGEEVLDAGCGIGGSAIWLAKNVGAQVVGLNINRGQLVRARRYARENGVQDEVEFLLGDFTAMTFEDATFDVVWAIESVCHALDKRDFIREAYRVLKPGGRLVIADGFRSRDQLSPDDEALLHSWLSAWVVPGLTTPDQFVSYLDEIGFTDIRFDGVTRNVTPSSIRLYRTFIALHPVVKLLRFLRVLPWYVTIAIGARDQYRALSRGLCLYGIVSAERPE